MDLDEALDRLFQVSRAEFVATRNGLSKELRAAGEAAGATRVKEYARPTVAAWAVNQAYFEDPIAFAALEQAGLALREAHSSSPETVQAAMRLHREAVDGLVAASERALVVGDHKVSSAVARKIRNTVEALAAGEAAHAGRLTKDLDAPGFDALPLSIAAAVAKAEREEVEVGKTSEAEQQDESAPPDPEAVAAVATAERAHAVALKAVVDAEAIKDKTKSEVARLVGFVGDAEQRLEKARGRLQSAREADVVADAGLSKAQGELAKRAAELRVARRERG